MWWGAYLLALGRSEPPTRAADNADPEARPTLWGPVASATNHLSIGSFPAVTMGDKDRPRTSNSYTHLLVYIYIYVYI